MEMYVKVDYCVVGVFINVKMFDVQCVNCKDIVVCFFFRWCCVVVVCFIEIGMCLNDVVWYGYQV